MLSLSPNLLKFTSFSFLFAVQAGASPLLSEYHRYSARNNNLQWSDCSVGLPGRECTRFEVPLDWHNDTAGKASLAVIRYPATKQPKLVIRYPATKQPKLGTLFMNPGGPGGSGLQTVQGPDGDVIMEHAGGNYDLVSWDPRGVGQTVPRTACFETKAEEDAFWNGSILKAFRLEVRGNFTSQTDLDAFYSKLNESDTLAQRIGEQCVTHSPNTFQYIGTAATVRDMVAMHDVLEGSEKINFWGMSYGTVVGAYFVNMFPDRVGRVILDGVVDPVYWANRPAHEWLGNVFESTEAAFDGFAKECANAGPSHCAIAEQNSTASSVRQWTLDLIDSAYDYGQEIGPSAQLNSSLIRGLLFSQLYRPQNWTTLSQILYEFKVALDNPASLNTTQAKRWLQLPDSIDPIDNKLRPRQEPTSDETNLAYAYDYEGIACGDAQDPGDATTKDVFDIVVNVTHRISPTFGPAGVERLSRPLCHRWPVRAVERYTGPWNKTLSNSILVIGNEADPVTPYLNAKSVADAFGGSAVLIEQAGYGHVSRRMPSNCTISAVQKYLIHNELPKQDNFCEISTKLFVEPLNATSISNTLQ
ncbi:unnamed protein product [Rhizoctonia solani]|uniref:Hydrolase Mb2248c n=1 Tax=Rhizoctonia solani TaxID=456999 RepID=A0A8H3GUX1_9AGAM|nr:unnamed protein product [Rhizoctonia solani]